MDQEGTPFQFGVFKRKFWKPSVTLPHIQFTYFFISVLSMVRSSHRRCSVRKGVPRNFKKFTGKHLCQSLFFNKVLRNYAKFTKKHLCRKIHWCFPENFTKFLRTPFLQNNSGRLLLYCLRKRNYRSSYTNKRVVGHSTSGATIETNLKPCSISLMECFCKNG